MVGKVSDSNVMECVNWRQVGAKDVSLTLALRLPSS